MKYGLIAVATVAALLTVEQAQAAPITVTASNIVARVFDGNGGNVVDSDTSTTFGSRSVSATDGANTSTTSINWVDTGSGALFDFDFDQTRDGTRYNLSQTYESSLRFTVGNADTTYDLSGLFAATDVGAPGRIFSQTYLRDLTLNDYIFRDYNYSDNTANESFTLGDVGDGDMTNINIGSLSGTLLANHSYLFHFNDYIRAIHATDDGASATGCVTLSIGGATGGGTCGISVPAPAPLALFGLGLLALGIRRKQLR